jgi:hypothetical protein
VRPVASRGGLLTPPGPRLLGAGQAAARRTTAYSRQEVSRERSICLPISAPLRFPSGPCGIARRARSHSRRSPPRCSSPSAVRCLGGPPHTRSGCSQRAAMSSARRGVVGGGAPFRGYRQARHGGRRARAERLAQQRRHRVPRVVREGTVERDVRQRSVPCLQSDKGGVSLASGDDAPSRPKRVGALASWLSRLWPGVSRLGVACLSRGIWVGLTSRLLR